MSEHLSETQLAGYTRRTLDEHELLAVDRHLASCDACHERLTRMLPAVTKAAISSSFEPGEGRFHLDYDQHLAPYVDGKADDIDREIVDSHVALCSKCATDLRDLFAFTQQPVRAIAGSTRTSSRWLPQWPLLPNSAWAMAAVAAVFIVATAVFLWTRGPSSQRVAEVEPPASEKPTQVPEQQPSPVPVHEEPLIALNDGGGQVVVSQRGHLEGLEELPADLRESVERALTARQLRASPALTEWTTGAANLRGTLEQQSTFAPLEPTDVVIETDRPTFRWQALDGASHYIVAVYDSKLRQVGSSGPVTGTEWTIPNPLARGVIYSWQISALKGDTTIVSPKPPLPEARFKILDQAAVDTLAKLKQSAGRSHLAMGVFYWKHGLIEKSEREFQALLKANPKSTAAAKLLASIRSISRR
jgi:hypothetical protein